MSTPSAVNGKEKEKKEDAKKDKEEAWQILHVSFMKRGYPVHTSVSQKPSNSS